MGSITRWGIQPRLRARRWRGIWGSMRKTSSRNMPRRQEIVPGSGVDGQPAGSNPGAAWLAWILAAVVVLVLASGGFFAVRAFLVGAASRRAAQIAAESAKSSPVQPAVVLGNRPFLFPSSRCQLLPQT